MKRNRETKREQYANVRVVFRASDKDAKRVAKQIAGEIEQNTQATRVGFVHLDVPRYKGDKLVGYEWVSAR